MIPPVIHRVWLGGAEPEWTRPFLKTWKKLGWPVFCWDDDTVEQLFPLRNQKLYDHAEKWAPDHVGQFRSDILRYELLHAMGGVYVDTDLELLNAEAFNKLIRESGDTVAAWERQNLWIGNTFLASAQKHPFFDSLIHQLPWSVRERLGERPARTTGPQFLTRTWKDLGGGIDSIWPQRLVFPYGWDEVRDNHPDDGSWPEEAVMVHHWANQRKEQGAPA